MSLATAPASVPVPAAMAGSGGKLWHFARRQRHTRPRRRPNAVTPFLATFTTLLALINRLEALSVYPGFVEGKDPLLS